MMYNVTDIEFDLCEVGDGIPEFQLTFEEEIAIRDSALGVYVCLLYTSPSPRD